MLGSSRRGLPTVSNVQKDFETFAALNRARILRNTAELLEIAEAEARETATGRMPPRTAGSGWPTPHSPPPCPSSSRITTTDAHELQEGLEHTARALEEEPRIAKNQDMSTNVAKILRSAAKLLERFGAASKVRRAAKASMALPQLSSSSSSPRPAELQAGGRRQ